MGWLIDRPSLSGGVQYMAMYRDLQGRQRSAGTFAGKREAKAAYKEAEVAQNRGRIADPKRGRQSFRSYVEDEWLPNHVIEESTREGYVYKLYKHIMPEFGGRPMREILPFDVRAWVLKLQENGVHPPTIQYCKVILDAIFTTALNDQVTFLHAGKGVKTPSVAKKTKRIITSAQFDKIYDALPEGTMQLLVEVDIETGLRWGELTELRVKDLDIKSGVLTVARAVVHLKSKERALDDRFLIKDYPKDGEWRQVKLAEHILAKTIDFIKANQLGSEDLLFLMPLANGAARRRRPATLPDPMPGT